MNLMHIIKNVILGSHPVGTIYMTLDPTFNPQNKWGGVWEKITDKFLVGAGNSYSLGATGGEATHTLTIDEMPSHNHTSKGYVSVESVSPYTWKALIGNGAEASQSTYSTGGSQPHNNLPPYLAVNIWKRTA